METWKQNVTTANKVILQFTKTMTKFTESERFIF